jgi:quercetin dioxygenase-like cupin family protein
VSSISTLIDVNDLRGGTNAHQFVGAAHGDLPVSFFLVHSAPGAAVSLHRHPYPEVFVIETGQATFRIGDIELTARGGQIVVAPADCPHGFANTGSGELRITAIHPAAEMTTAWLETQ